MRYKAICPGFADGITPMNWEVAGEGDIVDGEIIEAYVVKCEHRHNGCDTKLRTLWGHEFCSKYFFLMDPTSIRKRYLRPIGEL